MKAILLLIACITGITLSANAQKITAAKVPATVKTAFAKAHPDVKTVSWEREKSSFEAGFKLNSHEMSEIYSPKGVLEESETEITIAELPKQASNYLEIHYKGVKIKEAAKIVKASGVVNFEAEIKGKDILFDANGNLIK
ncbi:PepSY-like domain-containing protein [Pedobacter sp. MC2016-24]|uniref:PepSY-like domain-containing protein n=1 Tax=Pedobacter sp. MC2016-24 TaxID=2780090 RepID=UPI00187E93F5|nr:PepSY-like domain-containing protein [Pedobacter sp. MC2016-24]MBE9601971.1 PepSY-like domain-containing protein [Pedobacter sp. MC2016-24]